MEKQFVKYVIEEGIAIVTIDNPASLNALNALTLTNQLDQVFDQLAGNSEVKGVIITGGGEKSFVAGADITELATFTPLQAKILSRAGHSVIAKLQELPIAVIAAANGFALGGGSEIALACDFIYAAENARFGLPEITLGLIPGFGGTQRLPRLIGANRAKELIFTGKMISANEAAQIGLVNKVVAPGALMEEVLKTARDIAAKGRVALRAVKQALNRGLDTDLATGCSLETDAFTLTLASPDAREGTAAFLEKRKPLFTGKLQG